MKQNDILGQIALNSIENYFDKTQYTKKLWTKSTADEFSRVPLEDLLFNEYFLNLKWRNGETILYPYWIDTISELWEERKKRQINLVIFEMAIGSGKSYNAGVLLYLQWYELMCKYNPHEYYRLDPKSQIAFICMSKTHEQAKRITFSYVADRFKCGFCNDYFPSNPGVKRELRIPRSNCLIFPGTSSEASALGYNIYGANIDEASNLEVVEDSKKAGTDGTYDPAEEMFNATHQRMASRFVDTETGEIPGFIIMMSSPKYPDDFLERKIRQAENGEAKDIFWRRAKLWEAKPKWFFPGGETFIFDTEDLVILNNEQLEILKKKEGVDIEKRVEFPPMSLKQKYELDPDRAIRDYSCIPSEALYPFFRNKTALNKVLKRSLINPFDEETLMFDKDFEADENSTHRYMHIDLAKSTDAVGISMCHCSGTIKLDRANIFTKEVLNEEVELPKITFDFIGRLKSEGGQEIILSDVRNIIYDLRERGFYIALITFDQWQSVDSLQILKDEGFVVANLSIDRTFFKVIVDYDKPDFYRKESTEKNYIAPMQDLKCGLYEGRVEIPYHEWLWKEFNWAEHDTKKEKVDHRRGKSIDVLHSVAGSHFNCLNNEQYFGYSEPDDKNRDKDGREIVDDFYRTIEGRDIDKGEDRYYEEHAFDSEFEK